MPQPRTDAKKKPLTPEQIEQDKEAVKRGATDPALTYEKPENAAKTILIHIVAESFNALGRTWYRAQEIEFAIPSRALADTFGRTGRSWLIKEEGTYNGPGDVTLPATFTVRDDMDQAEIWGEIVFREGPWRGKGWDDEAALKERERNRAAPTLPPA